MAGASVASSVFGRLASGQEVDEIAIAGDRISARILTYGAILRDLAVEVEGKPRSVVLGFDRLEAYLDQAAYIGAIAGRYANRIAGGRFTLDGKSYQLTRNEGGNRGRAVGVSRRSDSSG